MSLLGPILLVAPAFAAEEIPRDWPGFRGPASSGSVPTALFEGESAGLSVGWTVPLGSGYSAIAVAEGRVVTLFASGEHDVAGAFDPETGAELWRYEVAETYPGHDGSHDGPISTPAIADGRVFGLGPRGHFFALDLKTGSELWARDLVEDLGAKKPYYGFTSSPVVVDEVVVLEIGAPEGKAIAGFDVANGEVLWTLGDDIVEYHSPIVTELAGQRQVVAVGKDTLVGLEPTTGKILWDYRHEGDQRAMGGYSIVPLPAGEGRLFLVNKIESSVMLEVEAAAAGFAVNELWTNAEIKRSYVPATYYDGHLYGISGRILVCVDAATGERKWRSRLPGDGFLTVAGDQLVVMTKAGRLHVVAASSEGYRELAHLDLFDDQSWSEVAIADGHLFARSMAHLARVDVAGTAESGEAEAWVADTDFGRFLASLDAAADKSVAIDEYLAQQKSFPILEGTDVVHFVHRGEAEDVGIVGDVIGFRREDPMIHVAGTDLFHYSARLEPDAAVTYGFLVDYEKASADPRNPETAEGLFGEVSWLAMPGWRAPDFLREAQEGARGQLETIEWEIEKTEEVDGEETTTTVARRAKVYLPADYDPSSNHRYPTLYFLDGKGSLEKAGMASVLDNLIQRSVEPLIAVFVQPAEGKEDEDLRGEALTEMIVQKVVPLVEERYPTSKDRRDRGLIGSSDSGATALVMGLEQSETFGMVGAQSAVLYEIPFAEILEEAGAPPMTIYMDWGTYDLRSPHEAWDMVRENREAWQHLRSLGYRPAGGEVPEGHSWRNWVGHSEEMLTALLPSGFAD